MLCFGGKVLDVFGRHYTRAGSYCVLCVEGRALGVSDQDYPRTVVLEKVTTILALERVWECSGQERVDVRQNQGVWWVFSSGKSEGTDFLAQNTLLQGCHSVAAVYEMGTTLIAWLGL